VSTAPISQRVSSIKQTLAAKSDEKAIRAVRKFIPTSQHVYAVRLSVLNEIAKEHRRQRFNGRIMCGRCGNRDWTKFTYMLPMDSRVLVKCSNCGLTFLSRWRTAKTMGLRNDTTLGQPLATCGSANRWARPRVAVGCEWL
jgi:hypothetical protein